jgi:hypothetical protein
LLKTKKVFLNQLGYFACVLNVAGISIAYIIESLRAEEQGTKVSGTKIQGIAASIPCPMLGCEVEMTKERLLHIAESRFDGIQMSEQELHKIAEAIQKPDCVTVKVADELRFYKNVGNDHKHKILVVVKHDILDPRKWVITAYKTSKMIVGDVKWAKQKK